MKHYLIPILTAFLLLACSEKTPEERAAIMLNEARYALHHHLYSEARDTILSLRRNCPTAIEARRQAILLLDSIEMNAAADSLKLVTGEEWERLNVKRQFFERKLQEDIRKQK
ncbi:MAG: hypothetical protein IJ537_05885 [Bacteroidaceae bacterium]|nr:hypothetical protein [Bacteroidaceae bacterium]MBQ8454852.1 hypothetical protein [Bacteroidaceae bacterium]MBQ9169872.1 hypothetical protein [Bacteroidaceae bacterium]MBQ9293824.1 hypothetical protein [Bacteroidaceae bacterium]